MNPFLIDLLLCMLTYLTLLLIVFRGSKKVIRSLNQNNQDDEGGLLFDYEKGPLLDLPPGVRWPSSPIKSNKKQEEWA